MTPQDLVSSVAPLGALYVATTTARGQLRVRTPFFYPDGGVVDVFLWQSADGITVSDLGESLGWLRLQTVGGKRSPKQSKLVADVCMTLGVDSVQGQLQRFCSDATTVADAVLRVAQAVIRVADLWFTTRARSVESMADEIGELLDDELVPFEAGLKMPGRSGRVWTVDIAVKLPQRSSYVAVLSTGSRAAAHRVAEHVFTQWHDLRYLQADSPHLQMVSLLDDTADVWDEADLHLVGEMSSLTRWSRSDEFLEVLRAA